MIIANVGFWAFIGGIILAALGFVVAVISAVSTTFFIISMIFLGFWIHRKVNKLDYQKVFKVSFIIYLSLSILTVVVPATYAAVSVSQMLGPDEKYVDTGVETEVDNDSFILDGVRYNEINWSYYPGFTNADYEKTPVANAKGKKMNIYEIKNDSGKRLLEYNGFVHCSSEDYDYITSYYKNRTDCNFYLVSDDKQVKIEGFSNGYFERIETIEETDTEFVESETEEISDGTRYKIVRESPDKAYKEEKDIVFLHGRVYHSRSWPYYHLGNKEFEDKLIKYIEELNKQ